MKPSSLKDIKSELKQLSREELEKLCLRLCRFKKDNKELLSYLLFLAHDEGDYINIIKNYIDEEFKLINTKSFFYIRKSIRKILRHVKKFIRYSQNKETEVELLLYFCKKLKQLTPNISGSTQLQNTYNRQLLLAKKGILSLHEDLQYDYNIILEEF